MKRIEIFLRNMLLNLLLMSRKSTNSVDIPNVDSNCRILFIRLNKIGDALVTTPLLKVVKTETHAKIFVLASKSNKMVFDCISGIEKVFEFKKGFSALKQIREIVTENKIDILVDTHDDVSTTVSFLSAGSGVPVRLALRKSNQKVFTHTIARPDPKNTHIVDRILTIANLLKQKIDIGSTNIEFDIPESAKSFADKFFDEKLKTSKFTIGINISAGSESRDWGIDNFSQLVAELSKLNFQIVLLSTPADSIKANAISDGRTAIFDGDFYQLAAIIQKLNLLISPDTSAVHLASAYKTPVFGIYVHDTEDMIWSPYRSKFVWVETRENNLKNITLTQVLEKLLPYLEELSKLGK